MISSKMTAMCIDVSSHAFKHGERIPAIYTCDGRDISPSLSWCGAPGEVKSYALIMDDPDAPGGTFTHWVVYDMSYKLAVLPENIPKGDKFLHGLQGKTSFDRAGYGGPCPPAGKPHRYFFKMYALDVATLGLPEGAPRQDVEKAMQGHILAKGEIIGTYGR